jgi:hypothetical protein
MISADGNTLTFNGRTLWSMMFIFTKMEKAITQPIKQLFNELLKSHFQDNDTIKVTIEAL